MFTGTTQNESQLVLLKSSESNSSNEEDFLASTDSFKRKARDYSRWSPIDEGVTLAWDNLSVFVKSQKNGKTTFKRIINNITGAMKPGSLVALMGSSGAGKSSLMSALGFRQGGNSEVEGDILVNGRAIGPYMRFLSGYMYQEDLFVPYLTVMEHMNVMANLKLDRRLTKEDKRKKILDILRQLGLIKCLHSKIGGGDQSKALSGGEKKRLAFATELLTDPPILFCDEATTGLDSYSAQKIVKMMNKMAFDGKTILCTIHQPSSDIFAMFSQVILLAEGRIAFMGSINSALDFFERLGYVCPHNYSPADFFIKTLANTPGYEDNSRLVVKRFCDQFAVSDYAKEVEIVVQYEFHMGRAVVPRHFELRRDFKEAFWFSQLYWLTYRWFLDGVRNKSIEALKIVQRIIVAVIVGSCYAGTNPYTQTGIQSVQGLVFLFVTENTFSPMYSVLAQFPENTPLFLREYSSGLYHPLTYYLSKIIALIPGFFIQPIVFVLLAYGISGLRGEAYSFFMTTVVILLTMNVASSCGIFFSNAFESVPIAMAYLVPFDYILMITSGLFVKLSSLPVLLGWTRYLSWLMYSTEALSIIQWRGITNITCEVQQEGVPCLKDGLEVLDRYSFSEDHLIINIIFMLMLIIVFYILGYMALLARIKKKIM